MTRYDYYDDDVSYGKYLDTVSGFSVFRMYNPYVFYALPCVHNLFLSNRVYCDYHKQQCFVLRILCVVILLVALSTLYLCYFL